MRRLRGDVHVHFESQSSKRLDCCHKPAEGEPALRSLCHRCQQQTSRSRRQVNPVLTIDGNWTAAAAEHIVQAIIEKAAFSRVLLIGVAARDSLAVAALVGGLADGRAAAAAANERLGQSTDEEGN